MARLNAILIALALACAIGVIAAQHQARKLYNELEREQERMRQLELEWGQLQLEASTWAAHARVEKVARGQLRMVPPQADHLMAIEEPLAR
jgi:cell division protein FtsL